MEVDLHLRAFAKGKSPTADVPRDKVPLPLAIIADVQKEKAEKEQRLTRTEHEHELAEEAATRTETFGLEFAEPALQNCGRTPYVFGILLLGNWPTLI